MLLSPRRRTVAPMSETPIEFGPVARDAFVEAALVGENPVWANASADSVAFMPREERLAYVATEAEAGEVFDRITESDRPDRQAILDEMLRGHGCLLARLAAYDAELLGPPRRLTPEDYASMAADYAAHPPTRDEVVGPMYIGYGPPPPGVAGGFEVREFVVNTYRDGEFIMIEVPELDGWITPSGAWRGNGLTQAMHPGEVVSQARDFIGMITGLEPWQIVLVMSR